MLRGKPRGFTIIEMMLVVIIIGVLVFLARQMLTRARPGATFRTIEVELEALARRARQEALARGRNTALLVFPHVGPDEGDLGKIFLIVDEPLPGLSFFDSMQEPDFESFDPDAPTITPNGQLLETLDLPRGVVMPEGGAGPAGVTREPFPYDSIPVDVACSFCEGDRGAIVFDRSGRTRFCTVSGATISCRTDLSGGSLTIHHQQIPTRFSTLVVTSPQGSTKVFQHGN
ncbi:MAG TPA: type II secretion system protein [Anaeromyxobacter sp.]|nr:type II secretion system protein [Anaeromyxobacter sp.]